MPRLDYDVVIIGSRFGGSVAALHVDVDPTPMELRHAP
jgi:hypothetical protein